MLIAQLSMYAGCEEESIRYHGLSSTDGNSQHVMKHNSTLYKVTTLLNDIDVLLLNNEQATV